MAVLYTKLWKILIDKKMSKAVLGRICQTLNKDFGDIMEYISDEKEDSELWKRIYWK